MMDHENLKATLGILKAAGVAQAQFTEEGTTMVFNFFSPPAPSFVQLNPEREWLSKPHAPLAAVVPIRKVTDEEILMNPYAGIDHE